MATEVLQYSCKKTGLGIKSRYATLLAGKKRARRSKVVKGINIKKPMVSQDDDDDDDDDEILGCKDTMSLEKKRNVICCDYNEAAEVVVCSVGVKKSQVSSNRIRELISGCGSIYEYECLDRISHGAYGTVYRARHTKTGEIVAVKKEFDGLSESSLMEINILRSLDHPSIVKYKQVVVDDCDGVYVVMEYVEYDLHDYMGDTKRPFTLPEVKRLMKELLEGVKFLHENRVMHRDLKPSNILINSKGKLKICDFCMSRQFPSMLDPTCTPHVCTLWYRAPELLLGAYMYLAAVDMWSMGCIMAEFFLREVLFKGESELEQLQIIVRTLEQPHNLLRNKLAAATTSKGGPVLTEAGFELLCQLLAYNPQKRITAEDALHHNWFDELSC